MIESILIVVLVAGIVEQYVRTERLLRAIAQQNMVPLIQKKQTPAPQQVSTKRRPVMMSDELAAQVERLQQTEAQARIPRGE